MALKDDDYARQAEAWRECTKTPYPSVQQARWRCHKIGARLRVYWCAVCRAYHVTNAEKRD